MLGLAMDDGSSGLARVFTHSLPNAHDVAASGIDNLAAAILDLLQDRQFGSESRHNYNVIGLEIGNLGLFIVPGQVLDPERCDLLVHLRIVNDFSDDKEPAVFKNFTRSISEVDGAFDA